MRDLITALAAMAAAALELRRDQFRDVDLTAVCWHTLMRICQTTARIIGRAAIYAEIRYRRTVLA